MEEPRAVLPRFLRLALLAALAAEMLFAPTEPGQGQWWPTGSTAAGTFVSAGTSRAAVNFLAFAIDDDVSSGAAVSSARYSQFLPSFAAFALSAQPASVVELVVLDAAAFAAEHDAALSVLRRAFPRRLMLREPPPEAIALAMRLAQGSWRHTVRFVDEPVVAADVTYIGDVDIMLVPQSVVSDSGGTKQAFLNISGEHLAHMRAFSPPLPYSNMLRPHKADHQGRNARFNAPEWRHLTGLHAVDTRSAGAAYYGSAAWRRELERLRGLPDGDAALEMLSDEVVVQRLCAAAFGLPERGRLAAAEAADESAAQRALTFRPVWGIHISPGRGKGKAMLNVARCGQCRAAAAVSALPWFAELLAVSAAASGVQRKLQALCACCEEPGSADDKECSM